MQQASADPARPDDDWLERLFREHYATLCTFAHGYLASDDAAEDLVQDLFVAIWRNPARWRDAGDALRPLLFVAARNRALDLLKHQRVRERHAPSLALVLEESTPPAADALLTHHEVQRALEGAIAALPDRAREIYRLSRGHGLTSRQIAERLGISVKTVETQMGRSLKRLRIALAGYLSVLAATLMR
jgi:RNA polymerase sigma-70 factor (ECF subfamily)